MEPLAICGEKPEPPIPRSSPIMMPAAEKVGSDQVNLILQGFGVQLRVVCGRDHLHHVVRPLAEGIQALGIVARCEGDASTFPKVEAIGDEAESRVRTVLCGLFSLVYERAYRGCIGAGHFDSFVFRTGKSSY